MGITKISYTDKKPIYEGDEYNITAIKNYEKMITP